MLLTPAIAAVLLGIPLAAMAACFLEERQEHRAREPRTRCGTCSFDLIGHSSAAPCPECNSTQRVFSEPYRPNRAPWTIGTIVAVVLAVPIVLPTLALSHDPMSMICSTAATGLAAPILLIVTVLRSEASARFTMWCGPIAALVAIPFIFGIANTDAGPESLGERLVLTTLLCGAGLWGGLFGWAIAIRTAIIIRRDNTIA